MLPSLQGMESRYGVERVRAHPAILLQRLGFHLPERLPIDELD